MEITLIFIGLMLAFLGFIGSIVPAIPGPALSYFSLILLYASKGESYIDKKILLILGFITFSIMLLSSIIPTTTVKLSGATKIGVIGSILGAIAGIMFFPPFGVFIGAFIGAIFGEFYSLRDSRKAINAGVATFLGAIFVSLIQITFSISIFFYFVYKLF